VWPQDDGLKPPVPSLQLIRDPGPVLQDLAIDRPHLGTPLGWNFLALAVGVAANKVIAEVVKDSAKRCFLSPFSFNLKYPISKSDFKI
jgi:hypothetical protein